MEVWFNFLGWLLSILTVLGNGFVVVFITRRRRLHSSANWFVLSLAVADCAVGITVFPIGYLCSSITCDSKVYMAFFWFFLHSSATNLCALTWNRYTAIVHPYRYITCMSSRRPGIMILIAWFIPLVISLSMALGMYITNSLTVWKILRLIGVSAFDILACVLLTYGVVRILYVAWKKAKEDSAMEITRRRFDSLELQEKQNQLSSTESIIPCRRKKHGTALFLIAIVTFFLICHVGINYLVLRIAFTHDASMIESRILTFLLTINSAVNPLVYALLKPDIKSELKKLFRKQKRTNIKSDIREDLTRVIWSVSVYQELNKLI